MSNKILYGIGAQKAGTSWLFDYFANRDDFFCPVIKELHYFDNVYLKELCGGWDDHFISKKIPNIVNRNIKSKSLSGEDWEALKSTVTRLGFKNDKDYFDYVKKQDEVYFADITPSYSMLDRDAFSSMVDNDFDNKFIFIMRDPVDRIWSSLRYTANNNNGKVDLDSLDLKSQQIKLRTDYKRTIINLEHAVDKKDILYLFYEDLFKDETIVKICRFLNVEYVQPKFEKIVNSSSNKDEVPPFIKERILKEYGYVYDFIESKFSDDMPLKWKKF